MDTIFTSPAPSPWALLNSSMILQKFERDSNTYRDRFIPKISNVYIDDRPGAAAVGGDKGGHGLKPFDCPQYAPGLGGWW